MDLGVGRHFAPSPDGQPGHKRYGNTAPKDTGHDELLAEVILKDRCPTRGEKVEVLWNPPAGDDGDADEKPRLGQSCCSVRGADVALDPRYGPVQGRAPG